MVLRIGHGSRDGGLLGTYIGVGCSTGYVGLGAVVYAPCGIGY